MAFNADEFDKLQSNPLFALGIGLLSSSNPQDGFKNGMGILAQASKGKRDAENEKLDRLYKQAQISKMERGDSGFKVIGNQLVKFDESTGEAKPIYTATSTAPINADTGLPERKLSGTEQKELFDTMDKTSSLESAKTALTSAKGILNNSPVGSEPYSGIGADLRTSLSRAPDMLMPDFIAKPERGTSTTEYSNLINEQALSNLKAIFGGNPTEGERTVLLQLQALPSYTKAEQEQILNNAVIATDRRLKFNQDKTTAINSGSYSQMGNNPPPTPPPAAGAHPLAGNTQAQTIKQQYKSGQMTKQQAEAALDALGVQ